METKICTKCEEEYPATKEFFHRGKGEFGLHCWCKKCRKEWQQLEGKESHGKASKEYYQRNRRKVIEYGKKWCRGNKESCKRSCKKWYENNKREISVVRRKWYKSNGKQYYRDNKERINSTYKKWKGNNKDKISAASARRRAWKLNQTPLLIAEEKQCMQEIYSICAFMNLGSKNIKWHVDHIIPLSKGGLHHPNNLQILEASANLRKNNSIV